MPTLSHPLDLLARRLGSHAELDEADRAALIALPHVVREFDAASYLIREGDAPTTCGVLVTGYAYRQKTTGEGARQIISLHIPGEAVDFQGLFLDVADHSVQTLTRAIVASVPRAAFRALMAARPAVARAIQLDILIEASVLREWVLNLGRRDARARVAHLLCEFATRLDAQGRPPCAEYDLPMTQEQFGDAIGLTPVHVNRTLKVLECEGYIVRRRRAVSFRCWQDLRELADFNPRYLHLGRQAND